MFSQGKKPSRDVSYLFCWSLIDGLASFERIASHQSERLRELQWEETRQPFVKVVKYQTENLKPPPEFWVFGCFLILVHHFVLKLDFCTQATSHGRCLVTAEGVAKAVVWHRGRKCGQRPFFVANQRVFFLFACLFGPKFSSRRKKMIQKMDELV